MFDLRKVAGMKRKVMVMRESRGRLGKGVEKFRKILKNE